MKKIRETDIENILALTPMQEGMLFHYLKEPGSDIYLEQLTLGITGSVDTGFIERAWNHVVEMNEMLRTVYRWEKLKNPTQVILKEYRVEFRYRDFSLEAGGEKETWLENIKIKDREEGFDLQNVPFRLTLCKIAGSEYALIISNHHILYDGWSTGIILKEFLTAYTHLVNKTVPLRRVKPAFKEFIQKTRNKNNKKKELEFWKTVLEGFDTPPELSIKKKRTGKTTGIQGNYRLRIGKDVSDPLEHYVRKSKITSAALLYGAWGILLQKYNNSDDVVCGTTVSGRRTKIKGIEDMVGLFINTLPLRIPGRANEKVGDFLSRINNALQTREDYETSSLVDIKGYNGISANEEIFDTLLVIENYPLDERLKQEGSELSFDSYSMFEKTHYDLTVGIVPGEDMVVDFSYREELFEKSAIERLSHHYFSVIKSLISSPGRKITGIEILSPEEKKRILFDFNNTRTAYPSGKTIHRLFEEQAVRIPDNIAVVGISPAIPGNRTVSVTYSRLNRNADLLAAMLRKKGVTVDNIVGLIVERSLEMITGMLGILKAGGAFLPIDPRTPPGRIRFMLEDSGAHLVLAETSLPPRTTAAWDRVNPDAPGSYREENQLLPLPGPRSRDLAYVIFTSGSTGIPKGVMVDHEGMSNLTRFHRDKFGIVETDRIVQFAAITFDASVCEIFMALLNGAVLPIAHKEIVGDYRLCEAFLNKNCVTVATFPPAYANYLNAGNLTSLRLVLTAGSSPTPGLVKKWREKTGYVNAYGPTEVTVCATAWIAGEESNEPDTVSIGTPINNTRIYIVDSYMKIQPLGVAGEICISGVGITRGYLNRPELTREKFSRGATPGLTSAGTPGPIYRTGDLGRWLPDGNIQFLGRIDFQVKIRGYRIELGEIETQLLKHDSIKEAVVLAPESAGNTGEKYLCAYIVLSGELNHEFESSELREFLAGRLPEYMVPAFFVLLEKIPLTSSGKVDRKALPEPVQTAAGGYVPPRNKREEMLVGIWSEVLGVESSKIGIDDNFFESGGHSLKAVGLAGRIGNVFSVEIPITELFKIPTVKGLSRYIEKSETGIYSSLVPVEEKEYYVLSSAQKRLFFLYQLDPGSITYNLPGIMKVEGRVERERFERAFKQLIRRHESLRTSFEIRDETPVQKIHKTVDFEVEYTRMEHSARSTEESFFRAFDLSRAPLLRVGLIKTGEKQYELMFDMHHIVSDGVSMGVLIEEFTAFYSKEPLPALQFQYKDFVYWRNGLPASGKMKEQAAFWQSRFQGEIPVLTLPTDYPRPSVRKFDGNSLNFEIGPVDVEGLRQLALETGSTLYMVLFALYTIFLSKLSGSEDVVAGTVVAGRSRHELENIIGMFVNTLAIRTDVPGLKPFPDFLIEVGENLLASFENQDYQYEELVETLAIERDLSRNPLFDTLFVLQNMDIQRVELPGLKLEPREYKSGTSKFDLNLLCVEAEDGLEFVFEYSTALFNESTIRRFARYFRKLLSEVLADRDRTLYEMELIPVEEKERILFDFNNTRKEYPKEKTIHRLFEEQVTGNPDRIAVAGMEDRRLHSLTYRELNEKSNRLAGLLREKGVTRDRLVGLMVERSLEMMQGILGILKAGGAYLPVSPDYPEKRINEMLGDCGIDLLLMDSLFVDRTEFKCDRFFLNEPGLYTGDARPIENINTPHDLAYVMYTSGSTGKSKGVMVEHRSVIRLVLNADYVELSSNTRILQTGATVFDAVTFEMWGSLLNGGQLYLVPNDIILDAQSLGKTLVGKNINTLWLSAPLFNQLAGQDSTIFSTLEWLIVGGDVLSPGTINRVRHSIPALKIVNGYGPTENTTFSVCYLIKRDFDSSIPIGRPIGNSTAYIVDKYDRPQPIGVIGELIVGGDGVSRGYLNSPQLTAEKFSRGTAPFNSLTLSPSLTSAGTPGLTPYPLPLTPLYRTGDLARWLPDGNIEFAGRLDDQVKIRGFRVEPGEIEKQLSNHEDVKEAIVAAGKSETGDKYLCAYIVPRDKASLSSILLREYLSTGLPDYMVPAYVVFLDKIPLNSNGKVDTKALPAPEVNVSVEFTAPRDEMEEKLVDIWSDVLGIETGKIGIDSDFFQLGGHSLKVISLISKIHKVLNVKISLAEVFKTPTVRGLSRYTRSTSRVLHTSLPLVEKKEYYLLSPAQGRLFVLHRLDTGSTGYNIPEAVVLEGDIKKEKLEHIFKQLIRRHESLRTSFEMLDEEPVQFIHEEVDFKIENYGTGSADTCTAGIIKRFVRPFDLARAPLLRVGLIEPGVVNISRFILMMDMHHIISDGASMGILVEEFLSLYQGKKLPALNVQYKNFSQWRHSEIEQEAIARQEKYWLEEFEGEIPVSLLPTDFNRPAVKDFEGSTIGFGIGNEDILALREYCLREGVTLYMVLLALFNIFLARLSSREEIVVGTPVAGRRHEDVRQLIGVFINTPALKNRPSGGKTAAEFIKEVKEKALLALENQDYPYESLVGKVTVNRDPGRNPLFDVMFALQGVSIPTVNLPGFKLIPYEFENDTSKLDLSLFCVESEGGLSFSFEYSTKLFKKETIERFIRYFKTIVSAVLENPGQKISELEILTGVEKDRLLYEFNNTGAGYPGDKTIHDLFERQVEKTPHRTAAVVQGKGGVPTALTYRELNEKSLQLAGTLREKGVEPNTIIGIMVGRSIEMITGIFGILKSGCAYLPIDPVYPPERIRYILLDSGTKLLLTTREWAGVAGETCEPVDLEDAPSYAREKVNREKVNMTPGNGKNSSNPAYVIYTSGSTGKPKGTVIEHHSLVNRLNWMQKKYPINEGDTILQKTPFTFDVSVWEMFWWALAGARVCFLIPGGEKEPGVIAAAIEAHNVTVIHFVPSMLTAFLEYVETVEGVKRLSGLKRVFASGEVLPLSRVNRFNELLYKENGTRLANLYGPTEATIDVSYFDCFPGKFFDRIPIGKPIDNIKLYIVDKYFRPQPVGVPGELCISGVGTARGYLNRQELTAEKFVPNVFVAGERLYRTGDLSRWLPDGNIEFLGRLDFQVKIRGFRIELGEIENQLLNSGEVKEALVAAKPDTNGEHILCAYIVPLSAESFDTAVLKRYLSGTLPGYMVPAHFVVLEKMPLTPNGKVDRKALPEPEQKADGVYEPPRNQREKVLIDIWSGVLGMEGSRIGIDDNFFHLGGHSLKAVGLAARIHKTFSVEIPITELFKSPTVKGIAGYIENSEAGVYSSLNPVEEKEHYPLSSAQKRIFFIHQLAPGALTYNLPVILKLEGSIDKGRFERAFKQLIHRHESLRTSFEMRDEIPVQKIHKCVEFEVEYDRREETFFRAFDLSRAPLLRVGLQKTGVNDYRLMFDMHHIVADGVSMGVLVNEFTACYSEETLPVLQFQYKDFAHWQNALLFSGKMKEQAAFWQSRFQGEIPVLTLPTDYPRPSVRQVAGNSLTFEIGPAETKKLKQLAFETGSTLYMVLFALYTLFLSKLSGSEDIVTGTVDAGRSRLESENIIGMFVNTLAIRTDVPGKKKFPEFLTGIGDNLLAAFENRDYQYEELVETLDIERDLSRNPLFDTLFVLQNMAVARVELPGLRLEPCEFDTGISKFDLTFSCEETEGKLLFDVEYSSKLFKKETVKKFLRYFKKLTASVFENSKQCLSEIDILSKSEKHRLLYDFNRTGAAYPSHKTILEFFEDQTVNMPDRIALHGMRYPVPGSGPLDVSISYRELNEKAGGLAARLRERGVGSGSIVGIMVGRSLEMVIGIFGILKAGGAYLPIIPDFPEERIDYILNDSGAKRLLTRRDLFGNGEKGRGNRWEDKAIFLEDPLSFSGPPACEPGNFPAASPSDLAYAIYTSGSTGRPKGVLIEQRSVVNVLTALIKKYPFSTKDTYLLKTACVFDVSVTELFGWFPGGGRLAILESGGEKDPRKLLDAIERFHVTHINFVPAMFEVLFESLNQKTIVKLSGLKYIFLAGEALLPRLVKGFNRLDSDIISDIILENIYGPTEGTVYASGYSLSHWDGSGNIPIGKPLQNMELYILDKYERLQPERVAGELYISGAGVGRGYLNRPGLTFENFLPNPFFKGRRLYRTGDLARWLPDGNIEFLGRFDHQVKIRGFRIELGEIENRLLEHGEVKEALVKFGRDENNDNYLCAYIVPNSPGIFDVQQLRTYLPLKLPGYMVPAYFVLLEKMPLNPNGKVDRKALPDPERASTGGYVPPRNEREDVLVEIWSGVLGVDSGKIGIDDNFFRLGGHSLKAIGLTGRIHKRFNVEISLPQLFQAPTIRGLSRFIEETGTTRYSSIEPIEKREYYALSSSQKRLFVLKQMEEDGTGYNISSVMELDGDINAVRLHETFRALIERHESLRTGFEIIEGGPVQLVRHNPDFKIECFEIECELTSGWQPIAQRFIRPFDLSRAPLLRVGFITSPGERTARGILLVDMHHIISDGVSIETLIHEFKVLYTGGQLPGLKLQYKDYSHRQHRRHENGLLKKQETYWLRQFDEEIPVLDLPMDFPRPSIQPFEGGSLAFGLSPEETRWLNVLGLEEGATLNMVLLTTVYIFLSKLGNREDIVLGTPVAGRSHPDLEPIIGMFVNTLALRNRVPGGGSVRDLLREVKSNTTAAFANQDYPFEELVDRVDINRDISRSPLFDIMFSMQNRVFSEIEINAPDPSQTTGLTMKSLPFETAATKFDLTISAVETGVGDRLVFTFRYSTALFKESTISRFIGYFKKIISGIIQNSDEIISGLEILSEAEKQELLFDFNNTCIDYPRSETIHRLFEDRVLQTPDAVALHMSSRTHGTDMSYKELNRKSNQLARLLRTRGILPDTIAGLMAAPSLEKIVGILAVLKAGGAYLPLDPLQPEERIAYMLADSRAAVLLTARVLPRVSTYPGPVFLIDEPALYTGDGSDLSGINSPADVVYTIYTSGTTGKSKGALIQHQNLVNYVSWFGKTSRLTPKDRALLTSSFGFDLGYTSLYSALLSSCQLHIIPRETYLSPGDLIDYIRTHRISYLKVTPSLFSTIVDSSGFSSESFRRLRLIILGGEEIKLKDVESIHAVGPHIEVMNHYGPTEATIGCIAQFIDFGVFGNYAARPAIGRPIDNMKVFVLDRELRLVPTGVPGELCVSGDGVIRGYLNRPELTAEKFSRGTAPSTPYPLPLTPYYRTGDLARWLPDGSIQFLGRIDTQVKIRGYRVELGEIEGRLSAHEGIKEAVVIQRWNSLGDTYLCGYIVAGGTLSAADLREHLLETLPDYMIPSYFVTLEKIPLTPNGKLNRKLLPEPESGSIAAGAPYVAPRDRVEETLAQLWHVLLGVSVEETGIDDDFFRRGGHSLKAVMLVSGIHKALDVKVSLPEIFTTPTIRGLASHIKKMKGAGNDRYIAVEPVEKKEYYELSSPQKRLFILYQLEKNSTGYNMPRVVRLEGDLEKSRLEETFRRLTQRHENLRTSFEMIDENPVQKIHETVDFEIRYYETNAGDPAEIIKSFIRPFDLSQAPLMRVGLIEQSAREHILLLDMHHIVSDAVSRDIFIKDFLALYSADGLPDLPVTYKDYVHWQAGERESETLKRQEEYWVREFKDEIPTLELPTDYARPAVRSFEGNTVRFYLSRRDSGALRALALEEKSTLYMVLLANYNVFLSKMSGLEDIVVGSPIAGRRHADLEQVMGMFVNTLALRNYPAGEKTFTVFLREVRENALAALENQDYPFEDLVDNVVVNRNPGRNPLFDVMFVMGNSDIPKIEIPGLKVRRGEYEAGISKFDLTFGCEETEEDLIFHIEYSTRLFAPETAAGFIDYFKKTVSTILENPGQRISEIDILSGPEKNRLLYEFNNTRNEYPDDKTIHQLFEEQVRRTPDGIALHMSHKIDRPCMTYNELNRESNCLARLLREKGITPDTIAGIMVEPSIEMITGIIGILKAGGAYLPIDPEYPEERIRFILEDSGVKILLTTQKTANKIEFEKEKIDLEDNKIYRGDFSNPINASKPGNLAYIIYTSGTTGRPKGVLIEHRNVVRLMFTENYLFDFNSGDVWTMFHSYCFDFSVWEMYGALLYGGRLILIPRMTARDTRQYLEILTKEAVTVLNQTPTAFYHLAGQELKRPHPQPLLNLKYVIFGGEALKPANLEKWHRNYPGTTLVNMFGITETTVHVTYKEIEDKDIELNISNIGGPIPTLSTYVMDKHLNLTPFGVSGEICVGGEGLGRGYLNRPGLTNEKFVKNPYFPGERIYRSGDLGKLSVDGELEYFGRIDHQVKIRGYRIELGEIEKQLSTHEDVNEAVVIAAEEKNGDKYLCAYIVGDLQFPVIELRDYLINRLPGHMIPSYFIQLDGIPLTSSGKVDRKALPGPGIGGPTGEYVAPRDEIEAKLAAIWEEELGVKQFGVHDDFFEAGGHSLKAVRAAGKIHSVLGVDVRIHELFQFPTIAELSALIRKRRVTHFASIEPLPPQYYYALSYSQKRLWYICKSDPGNTAFNMPGKITLYETVDAVVLRRTLEELADRHESLRTTFKEVNLEPMQVIESLERLTLDFETMDWSHLEKADMETKRSRLLSDESSYKFNLDGGRLFRVKLVKYRADEYDFVFNMHHLISDGWSIEILKKEFTRVYHAYKEGIVPGMEPLKIQYKDYAAWQNQLLADKTYVEKANEFWQNQLGGELPELELPYDFYEFSGGKESAGYRLVIPEDLTNRLRVMAGEHRGSLFMVLLAGFNILLSRLTDLEDIMIAIPAAARRHEALKNVIGLFVNTLIFRNYICTDEYFVDFFKRLQENFFNMLEYQDIPLELICGRLRIKYPDVSVFFNMVNIGTTHLEPITNAASYHVENVQTAKFDIVCYLKEYKNGIEINCHYFKDRFKPLTIETIMNLYLKTLENISNEPGKKIGEYRVS